MIAIADVRVDFEYCCHACGEKAQDHADVYAGCEIPMIGLPDTWRSIEGHVFCDKHKITITISGPPKKQVINL
jgi:hypothetical protein